MGKTIGVILKDNSAQGLRHDYFAAIIEGFRMECNDKGYTIAFLNQNISKDDPNYETLLEQAKNNNYEGVFIACVSDDDEVMELVNSDVIVAAVDKDYKNAINVVSDNVQGMREMTEYILSMGHRRIAILTGDDNIVSSVRLNEFIKVCENNGIAVTDDQILRGQFRDINKTAYFTEKLLKSENPPSCIIFSDDYASIGGLNLIHARGLEIPNDISVVGYDGNEILSKLEPSLTTVCQNASELGKRAAEEMIYHITNPEDKNFKEIVVESKLQIGRSVGRVYDNL